MKKIFFVVLLLYFILGVSGELWEDNITNIEDSKTTTDITETFNFPYDLDDITIQNMIVEVNANDVDVGGSDYDETIYIYNTSSNYNLLGELPIGTSFRKFIITDIINNTYYSQGHDRLALKGNTPYKSNNLNIVIYNITGGTQEINDTIGSNKKNWILNWSPDNISKIEITVRKRFGGDFVSVDGDYIGILDAENENTQFTIDGDNATNILSDGVISIKVDKSNIGNDDKIQVNTISVKVEYINNTNSGSGTTTKTPIPLISYCCY